MQAKELILLIERSFKEVERPEFTLRQFKVIDEYSLGGRLTEDEYNLVFDDAGLDRQDRNWTDISYVLIEECGNQLTHMEADDFCYYLPAYMRYAVDHCLDALNFIANSTIFNLDLSHEFITKDERMHEYLTSRISTLTETQKVCIVRFLEFMAKNSCNRGNAQTALEGFWYKNLNLSKE